MFCTSQKGRRNFMRFSYLGDGACVAFFEIPAIFEVRKISNLSHCKFIHLRNVSNKYQNHGHFSSLAKASKGRLQIISLLRKK